MSRRIEEILEADRKAMLAEFDRDLAVPHPGKGNIIRHSLYITSQGRLFAGSAPEGYSG